MEWKKIEAWQDQVNEWLKVGRMKLITGFFVLRAVWKAGLPERFFLFLFVLGIVLGVGAKTYAHNHFTIGYEDYKLPAAASVIDLNRAQLDVLSQGGTLTQPEGKKTYPACSIND